jgi:hypothetical protein
MVGLERNYSRPQLQPTYLLSGLTETVLEDLEGASPVLCLPFYFSFIFNFFHFSILLLFISLPTFM